MIDITEQKRIEQTLRDTQEHLEERIHERTAEMINTVKQLFREITERRAIEKELRHAEERHRHMIELISDSIYSVAIHPDGSFELEWGMNGLTQLTGYTLDEIGVEEWVKLVHPDDQAIIAKRTARFMAGETVETEYRLVGKTGDIRWVRDLGQPVWDHEQQRVIRLYGSIKDITSYRQTRKALQESERMLSTLMNNLPGMAYRCRYDADWTMEFVSEGCLALTGYQPADLIHNATIAYASLIHPSDRQSVHHAVRKALANHEAFEFRYRIHTIEHQQRWVWERGVGVVHEPTAPVLLEGFVIDITASIQAEASLRQSEEQLRLVINATNDGIWDWSIQTGYLYLSPRWQTMLGYEPGELPGHESTWRNALHPNDRHRVLQLVQEYLEQHRDFYQAEFRLRNKAGDWQWILARGKIVEWDAEDRPLRMIGTHTDIREQKQAEIQIRKHAARAEALARVAGRLNAQVDLPSILRTICEETRQLLQTDIVLIGLYQADHDHIAIVDGIGLPAETIATIDPIPLWLINQQTPVWVFTDTRQFPAAISRIDRIAQSATCTMLWSLMIRDHDVVGVIANITLDATRTFSQEEHRWIKGIADQAAQAMSNARLFDTIEKNAPC
ncbi:MAG: PAS domain-containing protein [Chloroflexaceae bacterium]|nr:PAS domain-containing protein [Chloroflexaceae bacterium]